MENAQLIHTIQKNPEEEVRLTLRQYKDRHYFDMRLWFQPSDGGAYHPTKKGLTLAIEHLRELKKGLERIEAAVQEMALQHSPKSIK